MAENYRQQRVGVNPAEGAESVILCGSSKTFSTRRLDRALVPRRAWRTSPLSKRCAEAMEDGKVECWK
jgi:hypothetical protein